MRTALALLLMASAAAAQRTIEGSPRDGRHENKPAFICEGKTDLPDTSRLDVFVCFGPYKPGRHLTYRATEVKDGKFSVPLPVFPAKTLAGTYSFHIEFNPYQQNQEVQDKLGRHLKSYATDALLTVGTEADAAADRKRIFDQLGAEINHLQKWIETATRKIDESLTIEQWQAWSGTVGEECHRIAERAHGVPEYKALGVDDISEQTLEDLVTAIYKLLEAGLLCVTHPGNAVLRQGVDVHAKGFAWMRRQAMIRLGLEKASNAELSRLLPPVRSDFPDLVKLYRAVWKSQESDQKQYYKAKVTLARRFFRERLIAVVDVAPDRYLDALRGLQEKGLAFLQTATEANDWQSDRTEDLQDQLDAFEKDLSALLNALKE